MNNDFPPRLLAGPTLRKRRPQKPARQPLSDEVLARRGEIARILGVKVQGLNQHLKSLTDEQREAVFYKVTHDGPVSLVGTGLKALVDRSPKVTLAIPVSDNLDAFDEKIREFETDTPKEGFVKNQSFANIEDIEPGDPKDRLSDELLARYDSMTKQKFVICEIEIIFIARGRQQRRTGIAAILTALHNAFASGIHGTLFEHQEGDGICRAVIRCTGDMFRRLVEEDQWQRRISWFEPKPQFETFHTIWNDFQFDKLGSITPPSADAPVICVIDSGITSGNPFLEPVTRQDMLKSFLKQSPDNPFDENGHGSGVASLAAYHAIILSEGAENKARAWIAGARILKADNQIEEERLFAKVLEEVVREFVPLGVRIFNLSVADLAKKWNQDTRRTQPRTSWTARTIDRLSREHDIVFVVCTGNLPLHQIRDYLRADFEYPAYLCDEDARILDPGQSGLALSVGAIAAGTLVAHSPDTAIALDYEPSPFTRSGPGIKGETKPDLVEVGGNLVRDPDPNWVRANAGTNVVMASHQLTPAAAHNYGTSFAAPRVAHKLAVLLHELQELGLDYISAPLLKAFMVNSASYRGDLTEIKSQLDKIGKKRWLDVVGYGWPDSTRATDCDDYSILLFHQGELEADQVAFFDIPVPAMLAESSDGKRITVTVAHYPEVQKWGLESYFGIDLKWRMFRGDLDRDQVVDMISVEADANNAEKEGDRELPKELPFEHKLNRRSRGSVQRDWFDWTQHREEFSTNHCTLAVAASSRWGRAVKPTKFAVVVRIEDLGGKVPVYNEVSAQLSLLIDQQAQV